MRQHLVAFITVVGIATPFPQVAWAQDYSPEAAGRPSSRSNIGRVVSSIRSPHGTDLLIGGLPLSRLVTSTATGNRVLLAGLLAGLLPQEDGQISGVAMDEDGRPLADKTVRATRMEASERPGAPATAIVRLTVTNAAGQFSFTDLPASEYLVEVLDGSEVIAGALQTLVMDAMQATITIESPTPPRGLGSEPLTVAGKLASIVLVLLYTLGPWALAE